MKHPDASKELRQFWLWMLALLASLGVIRVLPVPDAAQGLAAYLPLHITLEVAAISVALTVFGIAWSVQRYRADGRALLLGVAFLGVAVLDMSHTLSFAGMPDFVTPSGPEKAINFWLAARTLAAVALLVMAFWPRAHDPVINRVSRWGLLLLVLGVVAGLHLLFLVYPDSVPRTFIQGEGLTPFKVWFEYVLIALYSLAGVGYLLQRLHGQVFGASRLALAAFTMAMSEYFFTLYANVSDVYNVMGHVYKVVAYGFIYRALFVDTVQRPFEALQMAEEQQRATLDTLPDLLFEIDRNGTYLSVHTQQTGKLADPVDKLIGSRIYDHLPATEVETIMRAMEDAEKNGISRGQRITLQVPEGLRHFELSVSRKKDFHNGQQNFLFLSRDVTAVVENENQLAFEAQLNAALLALQTDSDTLDEKAFLGRAVELGEKLTDSRIAFIHFVHEDQNHIELVTWSSATLASYCKVAYDSHYPVESAGIWAEALRQRQPVVFNDYANAPHRKGLPPGHAELKRLISLPVIDGGQVRMMVGVGNKASDYTDKDMQALQILADAIWSRVKANRQDALIHRLSEALGQSPNPVVITDVQARIIYVNAAFSTVSGYSAEEVIGQNPSILKSGQTPDSAYSSLWSRLTAGKSWKGEFVNRRKDGGIYIEEASLYPIHNEGGTLTHFVAHKEDVTEQRATEQRIRELSNVDPLTGLLNKKVFDERLATEMEHASTAHTRLSLFWIDLDNFKSINESLGHAAGDELLVEMASRLDATVGNAGYLARYSGDTFVAIVPRLDQSAVAWLARQVLETMQTPMVLRDSLVSLGASVGIAVYPNDAHAPSALASAAEVAMYRVKEEGRNSMRFYSPEMHASSQRSLELAAGLRLSIEHNELFVVYQPQCALASRQLVGAEALLRWNHPKYGLVSPAEFIPIAEQTGLIVPIGLWVAQQVARQLAVWEQQGLPPLTVAVNISAIQFVRPHLVQDLIRLVDEAGISPERIEVELTEAVALKDPEQAIQTLRQLDEAGFKVALDDFGTGYSSMSYLRRYAIDKLKIDQSFVRDLQDDEGNRAIVTAIVQMAHALGIRTIAEGVETPEQADWLIRCGCEDMQGYIYSRPLEAEAFADFVRLQAG